MTTKDEIRAWFDRAKEQGATHLIVVCDTFDWSGYPVSVMPDEDVRERAAHYTAASMQKVMEVYSMSRDREEQMAEHRAFHYD